MRPDYCRQVDARPRRDCAFRAGGSQVVRVLAELPVSDEPLEALDLIALVREERSHEVLAEDGGQFLISLQRVQRVRQPGWQQLGLRRVVAVALQFRGRLGIVPQAEVYGSADRGDAQIWIGGRVA